MAPRSNPSRLRRPAMLLAIGAWRTDRRPDELLPSVADALKRRELDLEPRLNPGPSALLVDLLDVGGLLTVLDVAARDRDWAFALMIRPSRYPAMAARTMLATAERTPWGLMVRPDPQRSPSWRAIESSLATHLTILRGRRPAAWQAIDAYRDHGTVIGAAAALGCTHQAVSKQLRRANHRAAEQTAGTLSTLLAADALWATAL